MSSDVYAVLFVIAIVAWPSALALREYLNRRDQQRLDQHINEALDVVAETRWGKDGIPVEDRPNYP